MNEEFEKLFSTLSEKDQKEVANLIRFKNEVKYHDKQFEELLNQYIELSRKYDKLQNNWNELKKFTEDEIIECKAIISTILPEFEKIMPRSNGKTLLTNEYNKTQTIIECFEVMLSKMQELEQGKNE